MMTKTTQLQLSNRYRMIKPEDLEIYWASGGITFTCECGKEVFFDEPGHKKCECGIEYMFDLSLKARRLEDD